MKELVPFMKDIKSAMNYQEANLTSFNNSLLQLSAHVDQLQSNVTHQLRDINDDTEQLAVHTCGGTGGW